jgi:DUF1680 family protein
MLQSLAVLATAAPVTRVLAQAPSAKPSTRKQPPPLVWEVIEERFVPIPFEAQDIGGLFAERMRVNVEGRLLQVDEAALLVGFTGRHTGGDPDGYWLGEHAGKFIDAACDALRLHENALLRAKVERMARTLIDSQEDDGYLGTYALDKRWTSWDVWVHKYTLIGLLSYYRLTGDPTALAACRRIGDLLVRTFGEGTGQRDIIQSGDHMGMASASVLEPMCTLYRYTADARYLEFCQYIVRAYDHVGGPRVVSALLEHGSVYLTANAKAYEMVTNLNGVIDLYRLTGEKRLLQAVQAAWSDITRNQLYATGTMSALECFQPPGRLLSLPSSNVGETCVTVTWMQLNSRLLRLTGEARYAQELERSIYNHLFAAQNARNGDISYYTSLVGHKEHSSQILCCVSSGPRGIAMIPQLAWGLEGEAFVVHLYTAGRATFSLNGADVVVQSQTRFPLDGAVTLTINATRPTRFALRLRVPEWAERFEAATQSDKHAGKPGQTLDIVRTWGASDTVKIRMDLPVTIIDGGKVYADYVGLKRGPQVLAVSKAANPGLPYLERVSLLSDAPPRALEPTADGDANVAYEVETLTGEPAGTSSSLRVRRQKTKFVPFADAIDYRVWVSRKNRMRPDVPAVSAFARAGMSVWNYDVAPKDPNRIPRNVTEFLNDENPATFCAADPRNLMFARYVHVPPGQRGDPVWFAIFLPCATPISRVVFRHGAVLADGGWFDTSDGKPYVEVLRQPLPHGDKSSPEQIRQAPWERVAALDLYPATDAVSGGALKDGQPFEVRLAEKMSVFVVRVVGRSGGDHASCGELSAYA